jgi:hypothetical protein
MPESINQNFHTYGGVTRVVPVHADEFFFSLPEQEKTLQKTLNN